LLTLTIALFVTSSCVNIYQLEPADPSLPADQNVLTSGEEFTFFGDGQPGSQIEIVVDEQVVGEVTVDAAGSWSYPLNFDAPGDYRLQVRTLDPYDQQVANTSSPVTLTVYAPPTLSVPTVPDSLTAGDDLQVAGTGQPGRSVEIIVDGETVDTVTIDDDGRWRYRVAFDEPGDFEIQTRLAASGDSQSTSLS
jgi:hypothetical protein